MFEPETAAFVESGSALLVGTVSADGQPHAGRGWGADVLEGGRVRVLLDAADTVALDNIAATSVIAVTATSVRTLHSVQMKGTVAALQPGASADRARAEDYCNAFFTDIIETDGTEWSLLELLVPHDYVVCELSVENLFDQTPGPGAGAPLREAGRG